MSTFLEKCETTKFIVMNRQHLPENEYQRLEEFFDYPNPHGYGLQASLYANGVVLYIEFCSLDDIRINGFPVLTGILNEAIDNGVKFIDLYNSGHELEDVKLYNWLE